MPRRVAPLRVLVAPDKWKGNLTAAQAAGAIARGVSAAGHAATQLPLADGGEGTLDSLSTAPGSARESLSTQDALGRPLSADVLTLADGTAVVEAATCLGLTLVPPHQTPLHASSAGLGLLLLQVLERNPAQVLVALGGTATMDAGAGCLQALGSVLRNAPPGLRARDLDRVSAVDLSPVMQALRQTRVRVACDVMTPLSAAAIQFAPQKGATEDESRALQTSMDRFARMLSPTAASVAGGGAAGGLGAAFHALGATLESGCDLILDAVGFDQALSRTDLVITAEGRIDATSLQGKVLSGVGRRASGAGIPVVALAGNVRVLPQELWQRGISAAFAIQPGPCTETESREHASTWLEQQAASVCKLFARARVNAATQLATR
ncbi:MAG TPA: glycerate kinase [Polyangiaceae bacterium]|nr:glycerate kinase [Polyangiaceae bacterium]